MEHLAPFLFIGVIVLVAGYFLYAKFVKPKTYPPFPPRPVRPPIPPVDPPKQPPPPPPLV